MCKAKRKTAACIKPTGFSLKAKSSVVPGGVPHQFLDVMDYMISFRFNQSDTERAGRTMTLTKP